MPLVFQGTLLIWKVLAVNDDIRRAARSVKDVKGLLEVLNMIRCFNANTGVPPISLRKLQFWANPDAIKFVYKRDGKTVWGYRYRKFNIPKKHGGVREIAAPAIPLKALLRLVNAFLQCVHTPSACAFGFVPERSVVGNAAVHVNQLFVYNTDLRNFFPSIQRSMVSRRLQRAPFSYSKELAGFIASLCCMKVFDESGAARYVLPQGSPASPTLSNIVCDGMDVRLENLAKSYNLRYTRYADDITFSGPHNVFGSESSFIGKLAEIVGQYGFVQHEDKTRLQRRTERQEVTGLSVSQKVNTLHEYTESLRSLLYVWKRYGYAVAVRMHVFVRKNPNRLLEQVVWGKLNWIRAVKGEEDPVYTRLVKSFKECVQQDKEQTDRRMVKDVEYIETLGVEEFEDKHRCRVSMGLVGKDKGERRLEGKFVCLNASVPVVVYKVAPDCPLQSMYMSLCYDDRGYFWMLHSVSDWEA